MRTLFLFPIVIVVACSGSPKPATQPTPDPAGPAGGTQLAGSTITPAAVAGYYASGDWGQLLIREVGSELRATYSHDEGTIVGTLQGDKLVGWWCEVPSRQPTADAGDVELTFVPNPAGGYDIDGRWRYGTEGDFREDWDVKRSDEPQEPALVQRFSDASTFCKKP